MSALRLAHARGIKLIRSENVLKRWELWQHHAYLASGLMSLDSLVVIRHHPGSERL